MSETTARPPVIEVLYEDEALVAVNKPANLMVHAGRDPRAPNLQHLVAEQVGRELVLFHRLDRDTTGVVLLGKQRSINAAMTAMFEKKRIRKAYWAVVSGSWNAAWTRIETEIAPGERGRWRNVAAGGRGALSTCRVLGTTADKSWLEVLPKTGRTHQVRLHCLAMGRPILGDRLYGEPADVPLALHARRIDLRHPLSGKELRIEAPPPDYWGSRWLVGFEIPPELEHQLRTR